MKRFLNLILALTIVLSLTSCDSDHTSESKKEKYKSDEYSQIETVDLDELFDDESTEHSDDEDEETVYVSKSGKIHRNRRCSGMKYYTEMSEEKAIEKGYDFCKNCY